MKLRDIRKAPFFPLVPFVPLAIVGGLLAVELFTMRRLRRIADAVDMLLAHQQETSNA